MVSSGCSAVRSLSRSALVVPARLAAADGARLPGALARPWAWAWPWGAMRRNLDSCCCDMLGPGTPKMRPVVSGIQGSVGNRPAEGWQHQHVEIHAIHCERCQLPVSSVPDAPATASALTTTPLSVSSSTPDSISGRHSRTV